jgi:endonuclease/exonuclease/phosphatase family metal-dependent hydrolase
MIYRIELFFRTLRRWLSRGEWAVRLLRLPVSKGTATAPGLVMIQIDGLSHRQLESAYLAGRMPFLARLREKERYCLHRHYSGMPSSTPAVQGELFYGVKGVVPAFSFQDRQTGEIRRMFDPDSAASVERALAEQGEPLLKGGSSYSNIFTGGAAESHFCPASLGWNSVLRAANPIALAFLVLSNAASALRTIVLLVVEVVIAVADMARGLIAGRNLVKELKFVPTRVVISILLRELITIGAELDVSRGLPVVHLNFLGYDEQAHRRGPASRFAHWSLKGIDGCISRVWHAAKRSSRRSYDVWVYSDHGQEEVVPYPVLWGRNLDEAIAEVFEQVTQGARIQPVIGPRGEQSQRARLLGGGAAKNALPVYAPSEARGDGHDVTVASMGPVALVYLRRALPREVRDQVARALVETAKVPLVLAADGDCHVTAWTRAGTFSLPDQRAEVLGGDHPFLTEVTGDLTALCRHPNAGDFVLCGWAKGTQSCSFALENGSHGGPGPEESGAFALLPGDTPLARLGRDFLRPSDLREAAQRLLERKPAKFTTRRRSESPKGRRLRLMTYNVHGCVGMDGKLSPERIARVVAEYAPDVVALQELDVGRSRSGWIDQAQSIARHLEMEFHFHPALSVEEELYGDAILSTRPMRLVRADRLPEPGGLGQLEPRGALWVAVEIDGIEVQIVNTHLGLLPGERRLQAEALLGDDWVGGMAPATPKILCGDFNAIPSSPVYRRLSAQLRDSQTMLEEQRPRKTFFGRYPTARIDHVFVGAGIEVLGVEVPSAHTARVASDHLPLVVDLLISETA